MNRRSATRAELEFRRDLADVMAEDISRGGSFMLGRRLMALATPVYDERALNQSALERRDAAGAAHQVFRRGAR